MFLSTEIESGHLEYCSVFHIQVQAADKRNNETPCSNVNKRGDNERKEIKTIKSRNRTR